MKIEDYCSKLDQQLAAQEDEHRRMAVAVDAVRRVFQVSAEEVAVFSLDPELQLICFLWPEKLQQSGLIPLSSVSSLAARTIRENKAFLNNRFASTQHASIFEQVRLDKEKKDRPTPIQKILSAPLPGDGHVKGAVQISRKGSDPVHVGADFTKNDLAILVELAKIISRHL